MHVMVVDDDQFSAMSLRLKIAAAFRAYDKNIAISFDTFYSGSECIQQLQKKERAYSFLFIDCNMPGLDGYETVNVIDENQLRACSSEHHDNHDPDAPHAQAFDEM